MKLFARVPRACFLQMNLTHDSILSGAVPEDPETGSCIERLTESLHHTHDLTRGYELGGRLFPLYARYASMSERYVGSRKVNLWRAEEYEHMLVSPQTSLTAGDIEAFRRFAEEVMEPALVPREKGRTLPPKDHMRTYLTLVVPCRTPVTREAAAGIRRFRFEKSYRFSLRGYCQTRLVVLDLQARKVYVSRDARRLYAFFERMLR